MQKRIGGWTGVVCAGVIAACKPGSSGEGERGVPVPQASAAATGAAPSASAATGAPRSPVPQLSEWSAVREVMVKGSSALGCETKMVREWLRVLCKGKNNTGGTPTGIVVRRGQGPEVFTYATRGMTILVFPFAPGTDVQAMFSWTNAGHELVSRWPEGAAKPAIVGVFEGAASPLDAPSCVECPDEAAETAAKAQGNKCCDAQPCQNKAHCAGRLCCATPIGGFCRAACDLVFEGPTCSADAECPQALGAQMVCRPHPSGLLSCQGP